jgi:hypothetical protein
MPTSTFFTRNNLIAGCLAAAVLAGAGRAEKTGDFLQVALPVAAWGCSAASGEAVSTFLRFTAVMAVVRVSKHGLGPVPVNHRPGGSLHGFPSGHTAAAAFGVSSLLNSCVRKSPLIQGAVILSGGYVGASRIEAGAHFLFQVVWGALLGWLGERSLHIFRGVRIRRGSIKRRNRIQLQAGFSKADEKVRAAVHWRPE